LPAGVLRAAARQVAYRKVLSDLKQLQDCLGEFQDSEVQRAEIKALADTLLAERAAPAATLLAMGEIAAKLALSQAGARAQGAASFRFRIKPRVKGGGKALIRGTKALDDAIKGTDFDHLDLLPADFTYRNMDLLLGGADKKPTRKLGQLLKPMAAEYEHVFLDCPPSISLVSEN